MMEISRPDWLNTDFLTKCLRRREGKENIVVTDFSTTSAAPSGNNYGSLVFRVKAEYKYVDDSAKPNSVSLIVKTEHEDGAMKGKFVSDYKETIFYYDFVPKIKKFIETDFLPESIYSPEADTIVLEDLKEKGFVMADRKKQLDFDHCCLYLSATASLHAASVAVHKEDPEFMEVTMGKEKIYEGSGAEFLKSNFSIGMKSFCDAVQRNKQFSKYTKLLKEITPSLWEMLVKAHKPSKIVNTFNQGDPWTTNMMFKYDANGKVIQIKLLDFQVPRFASPVNDIVFFLWASANYDVMENRLNELYDFYLDKFNNKLQEFNCSERLFREQFMENVKLLSPVAMFAVTVMVPFFFEGNPADIGDLVEIEKGNVNVKNPFEKCYTTGYCENHLPRLLGQMEKAGVFDYFEKYIK